MIKDIHFKLTNDENLVLVDLELKDGTDYKDLELYVYVHRSYTKPELPNEMVNQIDRLLVKYLENRKNNEMGVM